MILVGEKIKLKQNRSIVNKMALALLAPLGIQ
jgi:hypothetical protein